MDELCYKMTKADEFVLKTKARASAQKMIDFQNNLLEKEQNKKCRQKNGGIDKANFYHQPLEICKTPSSRSRKVKARGL